MTHDATIDLLATSTLLAACPSGELRAIARAGDVIRVGPGVVLSTPTDRPNPLLLVARGEAESIRSDGTRARLDDSLHGAAEVLAHLPRDDRVVTSTEATVLVLDPRRLLPLLQDCPELTLALLRRLALDHTAA
jgi:hypothetical protein